MPLLVTGLPVFLRWRGEPPFGELDVEQLVDVCDRFIVDSASGPMRRRPTGLDLPFDRTACSDIAWRRTGSCRRALAGLWPGIADAGELRVTAPLAEGLLLVGWLRSRIGKPFDLVHGPLHSDRVGGCGRHRRPAQAR